MSVRGVDISNYTSELTLDALAAWKANGVGLVIVQSIDPPPGYPVGKTNLQIHQCHDAGFAVDAYIYLWFDLGINNVQDKLALLDGLPVRRLWLDVEDTAASKYDQATCEAKVAKALAACDAYSVADSRPTGIYTGAWFWTSGQYMGDTTTFSDRDLWNAQYDSVVDTASFMPYGGWTAQTIKQYAGTSVYHGVSGVDLDVLSESEAATLSGGNGGTVDDCQAYKDALDRGVQRLWIELGKKTTLSKKIVKEIAAEMYAALQS